jgi:hypothetical protein
MKAQPIRIPRHHAKRVDANDDGVSDRGSTPLASTSWPSVSYLTEGRQEKSKYPYPRGLRNCCRNRLKKEPI